MRDRVCRPDTPVNCNTVILAQSAARSRLLQLLREARVITLTQPHRGKFGRLVARVLADGRDVSEILISEGYGVPYDGRRPRPDWCS